MEELLQQIVTCEKCLSLGVDYKEDRKENVEYAYSFKPDIIQFLWIVESPPKSDPPRYFYRPELTKYDGLFREVMKALDIVATNPKTQSLAKFKDKGHFLIDAAKCPVDKNLSHLKPNMIKNCSDLLKSEVLYLNPEKILIIKSNVFEPVYRSLEEIAFESRILNNVAIPFPGWGQKTKFRQAISKFLEKDNANLNNSEESKLATSTHEKYTDTLNSSFIIDNITSTDIQTKKLRIKVANKQFFPSEIRGEPKSYPIKILYEGQEYGATYTIGSRDGKSRSGILKLDPNLYQNEIKITPNTYLRIVLLENNLYEIEETH